MSTDKFRDALKDVEQVALAYTVKTSQAESPEQFLADYVKNLELFREIAKAHGNGWMV